MVGAIIGDIAGSRFEWHNRLSKDFELFHKDCRFTDDTVMTIAVARAILEADGRLYRLPDKAEQWMRIIGRHYPHCGFGRRFTEWIRSKESKPYQSYGNGAAMRVSACAYAARSLEEANAFSLAVTGVTHNHPEGYKGAEAVTAAIYLARTGATKEAIREYTARYYPIDFTLDGIRGKYSFDSSCAGSVPQALEAFFESTSFEDAIRCAVSIGGDSDTLAAITGSIAEAYYGVSEPERGVPDEMRGSALAYLNPHLTATLLEFEERYPLQPC